MNVKSRTLNRKAEKQMEFLGILLFCARQVISFLRRFYAPWAGVKKGLFKTRK